MIIIMMGCSKFAPACFQVQAPKQEHVSVDVAGDNWFGPEQFSSCVIIVFVACVSPQPG